MNNMQAVFIDFENIAIWAEHESFNLDLTRLLEYLRSRGPVVIKRAYADWSRFPIYRDDMLNNSIDLIQMYSVSAFKNKNRADIRLALDALEVAMTRPQIKTFVVVSGDSDFGGLIGRLREYGLYTLGIGPRSITHSLLVRACDEYVYLETILGEPAPEDGQSISEQENARRLLQKALTIFGQRGELPAPAAQLKATLTALDPAFNEANLGYKQFRDWLEANGDLVKLCFKDLLMYVAPIDFATPDDLELKPVPAMAAAAPSFATQYKQALERTVSLVDLTTRRAVLRDLYRELSQQPGCWNSRSLLDTLGQRYAAAGAGPSRQTLLTIWRLGFGEQAYDYQGQAESFDSPVSLASSMDSEAAFIRRAESSYVHVLIQVGLPIDRGELALALCNDRKQADYIDSLLDDLLQRNVITRAGHQYRVAHQDMIPLRDQPELQPIVQDIQRVPLPEDLARGPQAARALADRAKAQRPQDFAGAAQTYLLACRLQWDAVEACMPGATLDDLRWQLASYAATKAGALAQVEHKYHTAKPYYLAFFAMMQEDDPLWERMNGLINSMLTYFWVNLARELNVTFAPASTPARTAVLAATHANADVRRLWSEATEALARVNPRLLRRVVEHIRLEQADSGEAQQVADQIESILSEEGLKMPAAAGVESAAVGGAGG